MEMQIQFYLHHFMNYKNLIKQQSSSFKLTQDSSVFRITPSNNQLGKTKIKEPYLNLSNALSLDQMIKKKTTVASMRLEALKNDHNFKVFNYNKLDGLKKEIEPHKVKSANSIIEKTKSSLFQTKIPEIKQSKHRKNISGIWKIKKSYWQARALSKQREPPNSFHVKNSQKPLHYELKMEIKKMQSRIVQKIQKKTSDTNFYPRKNVHERGVSLESIPGELSKSKQIGKQVIIKEERKQSDEKKHDIHEQLPIRKLNVPKNRYMNIKQHFRKNSNSNSIIKKHKSQLQEVEIDQKKLFHIKNVLGFPQQCNEETINLMKNSLTPKIIQKQANIIEYDHGKKTAYAYCVCYCNREQNMLRTLFEKHGEEKVQIASITKIMTCLLALEIASTFRIDIEKEKVLISEKAAKMPGTSAQLTYSDILTVQELLHGLMLPSGNDAAVAIGEWGGKTIRKYCQKAYQYINRKSTQGKTVNFFWEHTDKKSHQKLFITHMNKTARFLKLKNTVFANTHGLMNEKAYSTSRDVALLTAFAMRNQTFFNIVGKKNFQCKVLNRTYSQTRKVNWSNTNKLLNISGFVGVKTGVTPAAGPCLSSMFQINKSESIVIVVLKVKSLEYRFKQSYEFLKNTLKIMQQKSYKELVDKIQYQLPEKTENNDKMEDINTMQDQKQINSDPEIDDQDESLD